MWKERYKIGVDKIDRQHEELFDRLSSFTRAVMICSSDKGKAEKIAETFEFLEGYFVEHFELEESYQEKIGFPEAAYHKKAHDNFAKDIKKYHERFKKNELTEEELKIISAKFMVWLIMHVGHEDVKMAEYLNEKELIKE